MADAEKNEKIGRILRRLRLERGWSQQQFAEEVFADTAPSAFKVISKIETGYQLLSPEQRKKIEQYFKLKNFNSLLQEPEDVGAPRVLRLLSNREYFREHALFVDQTASANTPKGSKAKTGFAEIWFFHPTDALPVLRKAEVKNRWVENLRLGIDKHLVWPLTFASDQTVRRYRNLAVELVHRVNRPLSTSGEQRPIGQIVFWALHLGDKSPAHAVYKRLLDEFQESPLGHLEMREPLDVSQPELQDLKELLLLRSTVLNKSNVPTVASYCASYLDEVGSSPGDEVASGWLFNGQGILVRLEHLTERLKETTQNTGKKK